MMTARESRVLTVALRRAMKEPGTTEEIIERVKLNYDRVWLKAYGYWQMMSKEKQADYIT